MPQPIAGVPGGWLELDADGSATDLDLVVLLVNSYDALADPPDRLHDLQWFRAVLRGAGHGRLAAQLADADLPRARKLRDALRSVFEAVSPSEAAKVLNALLSKARALPLLVELPESGFELVVAHDRDGIDALAARLPSALASFLAAHGMSRIGTCAADPCSCAFIDRTRARSRRYCCSYCNDRAAARSYRARKRGG